MGVAVHRNKLSHFKIMLENVMPNALQELQDTFLTLQSQIDMLSAACQNQEQRDSLQDQYTKARVAYYATLDKAFHDDDPQVADLTAQLAKANTQLKNAVQEMGNISKTIDEITKAVTLVANLADKVIP